MKLKTCVWLALAGLFALAAPCGANSISLGNGRGAPGTQVRVPVSASPGEIYTGFEFTFDFNENALSFNGLSLSSAAQGNGIDDVEETKIFKGRYTILATSKNAGDTNSITDLGDLTFTIAQGAPFVTIDITLFGSPQLQIGGTAWFTATIGSAGSVTIEPPITPIPTGTPPVVDLSMASPETLVPGQEAILRYKLEVPDPAWLDFPADVYIALSIPSGKLFYLNRKGRFTTSRSPVRKAMKIEEIDRDINFGALRPTLPFGRYTFRSVLTFVDMNPLRSSSRISNLDSTHFDLVPPPAPAPGP